MILTVRKKQAYIEENLMSYENVIGSWIDFLDKSNLEYTGEHSSFCNEYSKDEALGIILKIKRMIQRAEWWERI